MKKEFLVVFEPGNTIFGAFAPDIPGCFAIGPTLEATRILYIDSVNDHLRCMAEDHDLIPQPVTTVYDFALDIPGTCSLDKGLHELRLRMKECLKECLEDSLEFGFEGLAEDPCELPVPTTRCDDGEIREESVDHYVVEWLEIDVPVLSAR
jgi:predicted RNase H-like HicB family nuclease